MADKSREYQKAVDYLFGLITKGELSIGSRIPTERSLSETLSISRNSTREAIRMLENIGLIESRRGSGNYITGNISKTISDVINIMLLLKKTNKAEICSFRRCMEKSICMSIIENNTFGKHQPDIEKILLKEQTFMPVSKQINLDRQFHYSLINATENQLLISLYNAITSVYNQWIADVLRRTDAETKKQIQNSHMQIFAALKNNDWKSCEKAINNHYNIVDAQMNTKQPDDV